MKYALRQMVGKPIIWLLNWLLDWLEVEEGQPASDPILTPEIIEKETLAILEANLVAAGKLAKDYENQKSIT